MKAKFYTTVYYSLHRNTHTGSNHNKSKSERPWYITEQEDKNIKEWSLRKQTQRSSTGSIFQLVTVTLQSQLGLLRLQRKGYIWDWPIKAKYWAEKERWVNIIHNFKKNIYEMWNNWNNVLSAWCHLASMAGRGSDVTCFYRIKRTLNWGKYHSIF